MDCIFEDNKLLAMFKLNIKGGTNAKECCHIVLSCPLLFDTITAFLSNINFKLQFMQKVLTMTTLECVNQPICVHCHYTQRPTYTFYLPW